MGVADVGLDLDIGIVPSTSRRHTDAGQALLPTLVITGILALVTVVLAGYAVTSLRASKVTDEIVNVNTDATAAIYYSIEMLAAGSASCDSTIVVPASITPNEQSLEVTCSTQTAGDPAVYALETRATDTPIRNVNATIEVATSGSTPRAARVVSWASTGSFDTP